MNHQTCDLCGQELRAKSEVRYEVRIEVKAAYDPLEITEQDLAQDLRAEIAKVLRQLEGLSEEDARNEVYRQFDFDLCVACQRRYVRGPLPRDLR
jgi:DNA repair exonuclease SbcCD ATPase subunit